MDTIAQLNQAILSFALQEQHPQEVLMFVLLTIMGIFLQILLQLKRLPHQHAHLVNTMFIMQQVLKADAINAHLDIVVQTQIQTLFLAPLVIMPT